MHGGSLKLGPRNIYSLVLAAFVLSHVS